MALPTLGLVLVLSGAAAGAATDAESVACALPRPAQASAAGCAPADAPAGAGDGLDALFARAESGTDAGRFDDAEQALTCAALRLATRDDPAARYQWQRRRGILDYRSERIPQALVRFECALALSREQGDDAAIARDLKNVGAALRRLGDFNGAVRALTGSLALQRQAGDTGGAAQNNLADVYRDLHEPREAMRYYGEAMAAFRAKGEHAKAAHVLESMAELSLDTGDVPQALGWLEDALRVYRDGGNRADQLRVYGSLIRGALAAGDVAGARLWRASALSLSAERRDLPLQASLQLQIARTERLSGQFGLASARLREALARVAEPDTDRPLLLDELASVQEAAGDAGTALTSLRQARDEALALAAAQHDRQLDWLRTRFETAERDRRIAMLETENRLRRTEVHRRTLLLVLAIVAGIAMTLAIWLVQERRRQRERLDAEARRVRHEAELARYRREADALKADRHLLQSLLDSREDAVCLLDAEGQVLSVNQTAHALLAPTGSIGAGAAIGDYLVVAGDATLGVVLERMEDEARQTLRVSSGEVDLLAEFTPWDRGDGLIVLELTRWPASGAPPAQAAASPVPPVATDADVVPPGDAPAPVAPSHDEARQHFRRVLVELMLAVVEQWERSTAAGRLEFAEKSRIWRINIDDGRLRARTLERYLSVSKLPHNPRWRDVLRSAYFVLGQCTLDEGARADLQRRIDAVLACTRRDALV